MITDTTTPMQPSTTASTTQSPRNDVIQWFRAIAIIAVIIAHTCPAGMWTVVVRPVVNICVPVFLFLSGYLTKVDGRDWGAFYKKRIVRVIIPYLIWTVIYTIDQGNLAKLPNNILMASSASHMYYILVYIQFVLLTPALAALAKSKYHYLGWFAAPVFLIFYKYIPLMGGYRITGYANMVCWNMCLGWFTFYYLGIMLGNRIIEKQYSLRMLILLYIASILLQMGETHAWLHAGVSNPGGVLKISGLLTGTLFSLIVYTVLQQGRFEVKSRFMLLLGEYSFGIYLCHVLFRHLLKLTPFYMTVPFIVNAVLVLALSLGLCYLGNRLLGERISRWLGLK